MSAKLIDSEDVSFNEVGDGLIVLQLGSQSFVMDIETLYDVAFRSAAFLCFMENKEDMPQAAHFH